MPKVVMRVTEMITHKIETTISDEEFEELNQIDEDEAAEMIGGRTSRETQVDGRYEDPEIEVVE